MTPSAPFCCRRTGIFSAEKGIARPMLNSEDFIKLDQFLKLAQVVQTGGEAKILIRSGMVQVNGTIETRRGRKLYPGDVVMVDEEELVVLSDSDEDDTANGELPAE